MKKILKELSISLIMFFVLFAVGLFIPGCGTKPPIKAAEIQHTESRDSITVTERWNTQQDINELTETLNNIIRKSIEKLNIRTEHVTYAPPDSSGKQHIIDRTVTDISRDTEKKEESNTRLKDTLTASVTTDRREDTNNISETVNNRHAQAERMAAISWWQAALMCLGSVTLIYIGIKIYKKKLP